VGAGALIVADTHALIWAVEGSDRLGPLAIEAVEKAVASGSLIVSAITPWEVSMLADKGRIVFSSGVRRWIDTLLSSRGIRLFPLEPAIAVDAGCLPGIIHGDPADRLIIATARFLACPLLTADERILDYAGAGHVVACDARM
jgi:PIN domain nuclease of toxin-antitoxin system